MCVSECPEGWYGPNCMLECACQHNSTCDRVTGTCLCGPGYYGHLCEHGESLSVCHSHTHTLLTLRHVINHLSSSSLFLLFSELCTCVTACPVGLYGPRCQQHCECVNGALCHPSNGHCICPAGYQGSHCQKGNYMVTHTHTHTRSENKCVLYLNHFHCPDTKHRSSTINVFKCPCPSTVTYHNRSHTYVLI